MAVERFISRLVEHLVTSYSDHASMLTILDEDQDANRGMA